MDEDLDVLLEFARDDEAAQNDADKQFEVLTGKVEDLELRNMLGEEGDNLGAILKINSGAGGTESNDWSSMLMRMYVRWGERNGYKVAISDLIEGDEAGIKSVTIEFEGDYAFGYLKGESGVHRLVRISPFNAQGKRQTTFSSVFVYPLVDDTIEAHQEQEARTSTKSRQESACAISRPVSWWRTLRPAPSSTTVSGLCAS